MEPRRRRKSSVKSQFSPSLGGVLVLCASVIFLVAAGVFLPRLLDRPANEDTAQAPYTQPVSRPAPSAALPVLDLPDMEFPPVQAPPPQFGFTEAEVTQLNEMLAAWAEEETFVLVSEAEELAASGGAPAATGSSAPPASSTQADEPVYTADGGHDVAVWFMDIESGTQYGYNDQFAFSYASLMKAPYAAWLYTLAQGGACSLEEMIEVKPEDIGKYKENTGVLKTMELPGSFSVETLIGFMLRNSDTVALKMLLARYPAADFNRWATEQGVQNPDALNSVVSGKITAADMGALMMAVYRVIEFNQHGLTLRQHMENAGNRMIASAHPVARKYGWDEHAYHDMGVVYAPHPFVVVIMTDKWGGSYAETAKFGSITQLFEDMMAAKWAAYEAA